VRISDVLLAESQGADLLVVGHRGLGDLAALLTAPSGRISAAARRVRF